MKLGRPEVAKLKDLTLLGLVMSVFPRLEYGLTRSASSKN